MELTSACDGSYDCLGWFELDPKGRKMFARRVEVTAIFLGILQDKTGQILAFCLLHVRERALRGGPP
jgi:hypothetical protein